MLYSLNVFFFVLNRCFLESFSIKNIFQIVALFFSCFYKVCENFMLLLHTILLKSQYLKEKVVFILSIFTLATLFQEVFSELIGDVQETMLFCIVRVCIIHKLQISGAYESDFIPKKLTLIGRENECSKSILLIKLY